MLTDLTHIHPLLTLSINCSTLFSSALLGNAVTILIPSFPLHFSHNWTHISHANIVGVSSLQCHSYLHNPFLYKLLMGKTNLGNQ